jgi:hypothetical protein
MLKIRKRAFYQDRLINDEARMSNDEGMTKRECPSNPPVPVSLRASAFGFLLSFVIQISSFLV